MSHIIVNILTAEFQKGSSQRILCLEINSEINIFVKHVQMHMIIVDCICKIQKSAGITNNHCRQQIT